MRTITVTASHGMQAGDAVYISGVPETRWYVRLWYFLTFRKCPLRNMAFKVKSVEGTTLTLRGKLHG